MIKAETGKEILSIISSIENLKNSRKLLNQEISEKQLDLSMYCPVKIRDKIKVTGAAHKGAMMEIYKVEAYEFFDTFVWEVFGFVLKADGDVGKRVATNEIVIARKEHGQWVR